MIVQIYEIQTPAEAEALIRLGVDHIGSVLLGDDWKNSRIRETVRTTQDCGAGSSVIPLYSDVDRIMKALDYYRPDVIHFCETLTDGSGIRADCRELRDNQTKVRAAFPDVAVMRSIPIAPPEAAFPVPTLELAELFEPCSDFFLTDTMVPSSAATDQPVAGFIGITGRTCDWGIARRLVQSSGIPVILAGGISPANVLNGIRQVRPRGVDSCTGTNVVGENGKPVRFRKDLNKVRRLVDLVRRAVNDPSVPDRRRPIESGGSMRRIRRN